MPAWIEAFAIILIVIGVSVSVGALISKWVGDSDEDDTWPFT